MGIYGWFAMSNFKTSLPLLVFLALAPLAGCLSGSNHALLLDPSEPVALVGERKTLSVTSLEDLAGEPEWEVEETYGGGFLNSRGSRVTYIAPTTAGRFHLVIRAVRADGVRLRTVEEIRVLPILGIEPASRRVNPGGSLVLAAKAKGGSLGTVRWTVEEPNGGTILPDGRYTAPPHPGVFHVTASLVDMPEVAARAEIRVE